MDKINKALAISAVAAFCVVEASAYISAQTIGSNTTINGTGQGISTSSSQWDNTFYKVQNDTVIGWRGNSSANEYLSYGTTYNEKGKYTVWAGQTKLGQTAYGVATRNGTGGDVYVIENTASGWAGAVWSAFTITGGTTTINKDLNNVVFASYRFGMQARNSFGDYDRLITVTGGNLNIEGSGSETIKIGFGNYGNSSATGGVWVRSGITGYSNPQGGTTWGTMSKSPSSGTAQSMNSYMQRVIEVTGASSSVTFNSNTKIVTTLDSTGNEPWYHVTNNQASNWNNTEWFNSNWGDYYDKFGSRALYVSNNARATFNANVETIGTVEFNNAGIVYISSGATLTTKTSKDRTNTCTGDACWNDTKQDGTYAGGDLIITNTVINNQAGNSGGFRVGRNLIVNNSGKIWYNSGATEVSGDATLNYVNFNSYFTNTFKVTGTLNLNNTKIYNGISANGTFTAGHLKMTNSTFDATANSLEVTGNTTFSGLNRITVSSNSKDVKLGTVSFATGGVGLRLIFAENDLNRLNSWKADATTTRSANGAEKTWTYDDTKKAYTGYETINKQLVSGTGLNNTNVVLYKANDTDQLGTTDYVYTSGLVQQLRYTVSREFSYENGVKYNKISATDHLYTPTPTPDPVDPSNPDTPTPTPSEPERQIALADARLQGLIDVHFMLAQFEMVNKFQTNFNPDEFIDNKKVIKYKSKVRKGNKVISRVHRIYVPYDYNIWIDGQYTNVSFANGLKDTDTSLGALTGTGEKQVLDTKSTNGKVGIDFISEYEGYTRLYFGYNMIDAKNKFWGNTYNGTSYEAGAQMMAGLKLFGAEFQGYLDVGYAYNSLSVEGQVQGTVGATTFNIDTNTHNAKAGLGIEKRVKLGNGDVGLGVDLDYVFSMGKGLSIADNSNADAGATSLNGTYTTEDAQKHYVIAGGKVFGGYGFNDGSTYLYLQGTFGYQLMGQDEFVNVDFNANDGTTALYKVKNAEYTNYLATAGLGLSQKIASNFNVTLQGTKLFSNNYTNDSYQARAGLSYKW